MTTQFGQRAFLFVLTGIVVVLSSALLSAQTPDNLTNSPSEITGHIDVPGGESLAGASVMVFPFAGGGQSRGTAKVDSSGNFKFTGLQPGLYGVNVNVSGLVIAPNPASSETRRFYRPGDTVATSPLPVRPKMWTQRQLNRSNAIPLFATTF